MAAHMNVSYVGLEVFHQVLKNPSFGCALYCLSSNGFPASIAHTSLRQRRLYITQVEIPQESVGSQTEEPDPASK